MLFLTHGEISFARGQRDRNEGVASEKSLQLGVKQSTSQVLSSTSKVKSVVKNINNVLNN